VYFKEEAMDMAYDLYGIDPGRLYANYFKGNGGPVVEANEESRGCWLKHLPENRIIGCPARDNFWEVRGFCCCLISRVVVGLPHGSVFYFLGGRSACWRTYKKHERKVGAKQECLVGR
jgi:hypothetical protein